MTAAKSKTVATWAALLGGPLGAHRFYLKGWKDPWAWALWLPTGAGLVGIQRVSELGQDDHLAWLLLPVLGLTVASTMLQAIVYGLMPDEAWHQRHNAGQAQGLAPSGWAAIIGVILALLVGATVLMSTIAFSGQRFFEFQIEEARKISQ